MGTRPHFIPAVREGCSRLDGGGWSALAAEQAEVTELRNFGLELGNDVYDRTIDPSSD